MENEKVDCIGGSANKRLATRHIVHCGFFFFFKHYKYVYVSLRKFVSVLLVAEVTGRYFKEKKV